ncbi:hypothetical protein ACIBO2_30100 [Nonomuraea sp. NPDC050022]|uniref:hypothetical protein n=1 Tax=unclassified Nonomuraea TaxID=2593643 RepID=UPI0033EA1A20
MRVSRRAGRACETRPYDPWVEVLELGAGGYEVTARAGAGEKVAISDPFAASFDPACLLDS